MNLQITRFAYLNTCTLGELAVGALKLATIERPWIPNPAGPGGARMVSCVPDGTYSLQPWDSSRFPGTYILVNNALGVYTQPNLIPPGQTFGRSAILIHRANFVQDVIGCIGVGLRHSSDGAQHRVVDSSVALMRLREVLGRELHTLHIRPCSGTQEVA